MCIHNAEYGTDLKLDTDLAMFLFATKAMMCLTWMKAVMLCIIIGAI